MTVITQKQLDLAFNNYHRLVYSPRPRGESPFKREQQWRTLSETLVHYASEAGQLIQALSAILDSHEKGDTPLANKKWSSSDEEFIVEQRAEGNSLKNIAAVVGRSPFAVATKLSSLVGVPRNELLIEGYLKGDMEGEAIEGRFEGKLIKK